MTWYIARTQPSRWRVAVKSLTEAGYLHYLPMAVEWSRHPRLNHRQRIERPYFIGGYFFVAIPDGEFSAVEALSGVSGILHYKNNAGDWAPRSCASETVSSIMQAEHAGEFDATRQDHASFTVGMRVRVKRGRLADIVGTVDSFRNAGRVVLTPDRRNGSPVKPVEMAGEDLERVA